MAIRLTSPNNVTVSTDLGPHNVSDTCISHTNHTRSIYSFHMISYSSPQHNLHNIYSVRLHKKTQGYVLPTTKTWLFSMIYTTLNENVLSAWILQPKQPKVSLRGLEMLLLCLLNAARDLVFRVKCSCKEKRIQEKLNVPYLSLGRSTPSAPTLHKDFLFFVCRASFYIGPTENCPTAIEKEQDTTFSVSLLMLVDVRIR